MFGEMVRQADENRWGAVEELLAVLVERVDMLLRVTVSAHSDPKRRPSFGAPLHVPRPGEKTTSVSIVVRPGQLFAMVSKGGE